MPNVENERGHRVERLVIVRGAALDVPLFRRIHKICLLHGLEIDLVANASDADFAKGCTFCVMRLDGWMGNVVVKVPAWNFDRLLFYGPVKIWQSPPCPWYIHFVAGVFATTVLALPAVVCKSNCCTTFHANRETGCIPDELLLCLQNEAVVWC